ncbi:hypothetical protein E2F43_06920 [Seongchinamella unica]|uniref:Uncharacterized protein n=1 Tax=Seongchinamella unica TaxID=2547392 RepID=A0A4R5LWX6_9GAMM|nr:hypothetical protein [Seongchinamella unica]TDG15951.1 hypothetical protein E2F43_06920 [Seongchinamella unica]
MKALLAVPAMLIAMNAAADCPAKRPTEAPEMPAVATASKADMAAAQAATQTYVDSVVDFLNCRNYAMHDVEYNYFVEAAYSAAQTYNDMLREYQQRDALASN